MPLIWDRDIFFGNPEDDEVEILEDDDRELIAEIIRHDVAAIGYFYSQNREDDFDPLDEEDDDDGYGDEYDTSWDYENDYDWDDDDENDEDETLDHSNEPIDSPDYSRYIF